MKIDFNDLKEVTINNMNNGTGEVKAKMYMDKDGKIIYSIIPPHSSIGMHTHNTSDDINYVLEGEGIAICNDIEEELHPGIIHICKKGSSHSIINNSDKDLILFTVVSEK